MSSTLTLAVSADPAVGPAPTHAWTAEIGSVRVTFGAGVLARVGELARELDGRRVLVVTDPGLRAAGYPAYAAQALIAAGCEVRIFDDVGENPTTTEVEAGARAVADLGAELLVAVGGGSVLDAAKAASMLATNVGSCVAYEGRNRFAERPLPFIAVPTTCGTGSEVTWVSVISVPERRAKISVKGDGMFPRYALVDADLLATLPPHLVAWTGLDALTHALEATTGALANPASDALAERAIELLFRHLRRAARDVAGDADARQAVMTASTLAGLAFGNADVAAVHCLSETLGGLYDVPHGLANAVLLEPVLAAHGASVEGKLADLERAATGESTSASPGEAAERVLAAIGALVSDLGTPGFGDLGVLETDFQEIARRAVANGSNASNPRLMGEREYLAILERLAAT